MTRGRLVPSWSWCVWLPVYGALAAIAACGGDDAPTSTPTAPPGEIIGRIEVAEDVPLGACQVLLEGTPLGARCDESGLFDIRRVPPGRWDLRVVPDGAKGVPARRIAAASNPGFVTDVGAVRIAPAGSIGGHILSAQGTPPFAVISVPAYGAVTAPNANGGYLLERVPPGVHEVVLTTDDGRVIRQNVTVLPSRVTIGIDFDLGELSPVTVQVSGNAQKLVRDGVSLRNADDSAGLTVELLDARGGTVRATATTDAGGNFSLSAPQGPYVLRVSGADRQPRAIVPYVLLYRDEPYQVPQQLLLPPDDEDLDGDGMTGAADSDQDGDAVPDATDEFPLDPAESEDVDGDGLGDNADLQTTSETVDDHTPTPDTDNDGKLDFEDNCPEDVNLSQADADGDGVGDACDNCPFIVNPDQQDSIGNGEGDACRTCVPGDPCSPQNPCNLGFITCTAGGPVCADSGTQRPNGDPCGTDMFCSGGVCMLCMSGDGCAVPGDPCVQGVTSCTTGVPVCSPTAVDVANGTPCGAGQVCKDGSCVNCNTGSACTPASDPCHAGMLDCASGDPVCQATVMPVPDGTSCGTNLFCNGGACVACAQDDPCTPANVCHAGHIECGTGSAVCVDDGTPANDFAPCGGPNQFCQAGTCSTLADALTVTGGNNQTGKVNELLATPIAVTLTDGGGAPIVGRTVSFTAPPGGVITPATTTTGPGGIANASIRLPGVAGAYTYTATASGAPPVDISATATIAGTAGQSISFANVDHVSSGGEGNGGPAVSAHLNNPAGMVVASDGTVYFAETSRHKVKKVDPSGVISVVAGTGTAGSAGDNGQGTAAQLNAPQDVALDETDNVLYIVDTNNDKVRAVNLTTGVITTYAGGGPAGAADPFGDGGPANAATLSTPARVSLHPITRDLYIVDNSHHRVRVVNRVTRTISTLIVSASGSFCSGKLSFGQCISTVGQCSITHDAQGRLFLAAALCGTEVGNTINFVPGIVRVADDGSITHVAGQSGGSSGEGVPATSAALTTPADLAFDTAGNLYVVDSGSSVNKVRRIDGRTGLITTVAGTGAAANAAEFATAASSPLNDPDSLTFFASGDLLVSEQGGETIRRIFAAGAALPTPITLAVDSGNNQTVERGRSYAQPLVAKVTSSGVVVSGARVLFDSPNPGLGLTGSPAFTTPGGLALVSARAPFDLGAQSARARFFDIHGVEIPGSPITFSLTVSAPADGIIWSASNSDHTNSNPTGMGGPAVFARHGQVRAVVAASDGRIYFADTIRVYEISAQGQIRIVAGNGTQGFNGDFASDATQAALSNVFGLALDEAGGILYISDRNNNRIRAVDLATGALYKYAGGGAGSGDGGPAINAAITPGPIAFDPLTGVLYLSDSSPNRVRKIDPLAPFGSGGYTPGAAGGTLNSVLLNQGTGCAGGFVFIDCSVGNVGCALAVDATHLYFTARVCGGGAGTNFTNGIGRMAFSDGTLSHIAGEFGGGAPTDGAMAADVTLSSFSLDGIAVGAGQVFFSQTNVSPNSKVRSVNLASGMLGTAAGTGTAGFNGDYVPGPSANVNQPSGLFFIANHLYIADFANAGIRIVE